MKMERVRLDVCDDRPLRSWIHSFGPLARVVSPARLAQDIFEEIEEARERYTSTLTFPPFSVLRSRPRFWQYHEEGRTGAVTLPLERRVDI